MFGWANVSVRKDGTALVDLDEDHITPESLEKVAYHYVLHSRVGGEMHKIRGVSTLVESMVFTAEKLAALGLPDDSLPTGWWVGFKVHDDDVWKAVREGEYRMFSIHGFGRAESMEEA